MAMSIIEAGVVRFVRRLVYLCTLWRAVIVALRIASAAPRHSKDMFLALGMSLTAFLNVSWGLLLILFLIALSEKTVYGAAVWASVRDSFVTCAKDFIATRVIGRASCASEFLEHWDEELGQWASTENTAAAARATVPVTPGTVAGANLSTPPRKDAAAPVAPTGNTQDGHPAKRVRC